MNPPTQSTITTSGASAIAGVGVWLTDHGYISANDVVSLSPLVLLLATWILTAWFKANQVTKPSLIEAVNKGRNGVRVIRADVPEDVAPTVNAPIK